MKHQVVKLLIITATILSLTACGKASETVLPTTEATQTTIESESDIITETETATVESDTPTEPAETTSVDDTSSATDESTYKDASKAKDKATKETRKETKESTSTSNPAPSTPIIDESKPTKGISVPEPEKASEPAPSETPSSAPKPTPEPAPEPPHVHKYAESTVLEPTCGVEGKKAYACQCGDEYTETIPATGNHGSTSLHYDGGFYFEPRCEGHGYAWVKCDVCDKGVTAVVVEATGHIQDEDFWNAHNICSESGTGAFASIPCKKCGNNTENRLITATHNFVKVGSIVGEFDEILYVYECTECGKTYNDYN